MTVNGSMIKLMDSESIAILMEPNTRVIGRKISNTVMDLRHGLMVLVMKVNISKVKNTDMEDSLGLMAAHIMESSLRTTSKVKVSIIGQIKENMMAHG
jgi:hypothetical protein|tara:strand:+ start:597 stop:890 length:294 start_codon:yes stop_codon:yes gene_type:complete